VSAQAAGAGAPERWDVLVVDDEPVVRDAIRLVLEAGGLRVATVADSAAALAHPAAESCRLVLCDLMLPESSGLEVLRALRARRPGLPVVMITGYATAEVAVESLRCGAAGFLPKPFDDTELMNQVRQALATRDAAGKESVT
jgi:DNA-binding NtrC family response regulator